MAKKKRKLINAGMAPITEKQWQAECDARTLADAEKIKKDRGRVNAAAKAAKKMVKEKMQEAQAMSKIAKGKAK